jgi:hypothetical protein
MSRATLERKLDQALRAVEREQERGSDQEALALIRASLMRKLAQCSGQDQDRQTASELQLYTTCQRQMIASFSRRYNVAGARDVLTRQLEQKIKQGEEDSRE